MSDNFLHPSAFSLFKKIKCKRSDFSQNNKSEVRVKNYSHSSCQGLFRYLLRHRIDFPRILQRLLHENFIMITLGGMKQPAGYDE